jgi:hypothetical protein
MGVYYEERIGGNKVAYLLGFGEVLPQKVAYGSCIKLF